MLRRQFLTLATVGTLFASLFATSAFADSLRHERLRLFEAAERLAQASEAVRFGNDHEAERHLRIAYYRVRISYISLQRRVVDQQALQALQVTYEKLSDDYLTAGEKAEIGLDCLGVTLKILIQNNFRGERAVRQYANLATKLARGHVFGRAVEVLTAAKRALQRMCPIQYAGSIEAIDVAIEKAEDVILTSDDKEFYVVDCLRVALQRLRGF